MAKGEGISFLLMRLMPNIGKRISFLLLRLMPSNGQWIWIPEIENNVRYGR
jgi:hypothetical protein